MTSTRVNDFNLPARFERFVGAPSHRLFAIFDDAREGARAVAAIPKAQIVGGETVWQFHGEEGRRRLDAKGTRHGIRGRFVRLVQRSMTDDNRYIDQLDDALQDGGLVVALPVANIKAADRLARSLQNQSAHAFAYCAHWDYVPTRNEI